MDDQSQNIKINYLPTCADAANSAAQNILKFLNRVFEENKTALILLSGGSSVEVAKQIINAISDDHVEHVLIGQTDEHFGVYGHENSNWRKLTDEIPRLQQFTTLPILHDHEEILDTTKKYGDKMLKELGEADYLVALLEVGVDGSTAGILPGDEEYFHKFIGEPLFVHYDGPDYQRISCTFSLLSLFNDVVVFTCGHEQVMTLNKLKQDLPAHEHPIQLLKDHDHVTIYASEGD